MSQMERMLRSWTLLLMLMAASCFQLFANMASPIQEGTFSALPFTSQYISIVKENIRMRPDAEFRHCHFEVTYFIQADSNGLQIPFLFIAENYDSGFQIWLDGKPVKLLNVRDQNLENGDSTFALFSHVFEKDDEGRMEVAVQWDSITGAVYSLEDLHYFAANITAGAHEIKVEYIAEVWEDRSYWVLNSNFRYSLEPSKYWKSFGHLHLELDQRACKKKIAINLGPSKSGESENLRVWDFEQLPGDLLTLGLVVEVSGLAKTMISIDRDGFMWLSGVLFFMIHLLMMWQHRKRKPEKGFSALWLVGSFLIPLASLFVYIFSKSWINAALGDAASHRADYAFLIMILYPVALIGYGLLAWLADFGLRKIYRKK